MHAGAVGSEGVKTTPNLFQAAAGGEKSKVLREGSEHPLGEERVEVYALIQAVDNPEVLRQGRLFEDTAGK
jgi:hypothetical protein